ncbi:Glyoxylate/hydroxypyruvate reductase B [Candidatus Entotheonellaceae bacterium PAL068K]
MTPLDLTCVARHHPAIAVHLLVRAMQANKILAAGCDVLEAEPTPADNSLLDMDNVLVTPHMAGFIQEGFEKSRVFAIQNTARVVRGEEPESVVEPVSW